MSKPVLAPSQDVWGLDWLHLLTSGNPITGVGAGEIEQRSISLPKTRVRISGVLQPMGGAEGPNAGAKHWFLCLPRWGVRFLPALAAGCSWDVAKALFAAEQGGVCEPAGTLQPDLAWPLTK